MQNSEETQKTNKSTFSQETLEAQFKLLLEKKSYDPIEKRLPINRDKSNPTSSTSIRDFTQPLKNALIPVTRTPTCNPPTMTWIVEQRHIGRGRNKP